MPNSLRHPGPDTGATSVRAEIAPRVGLIVVIVLAMLGPADDAHAQGATPAGSPAVIADCVGTSAGGGAPVSDPFPANAAGWGAAAGTNRFVSRWAEDWTCLRARGVAPPLKAMPLGGWGRLTLGAEARVRVDGTDNGQLTSGNDFQRGLFRGILSADLRFNRHLHVYGEVGTGQIEGRRGTAGANLQNAASLQQALVDARGHVRSTLVGMMVGRQEFADGPRQLLSVSDSGNIHRTWNGARGYVHGRRARLGAFALRLTRLGSGAFDEDVNADERLEGLNASLLVVSGEAGTGLYLDPFWFHSENPAFRSGGRTGLDRRDTYGARVWGRRRGLSVDWTLARQTGRHVSQDVDAWAAFAVQSLGLSDKGWKPRFTGRVDVASGGGAGGNGTLKDFNQLYASSSYLGDALFLSTSNLLLVAPGVSVTPTSATTFSVEYGIARRLDERAAAYAGQMRAYAGTEDVPGRAIGGLLRAAATWSLTGELTLFADLEHLAAGDVLTRAHLPSGTYGYIGATFRY